MNRRSRSRRSGHEARDSGRRATALAMLLVFGLSLGVHGLVWLQYRSDPFHETYVSDALSYHEWAQGIAAAGVAAEPVFHQSPLFPLALGWVYSVTAEPARASVAVLMLVLLNSTALAMLVPLGRTWFGSTETGIASAVLALLHAPLAFHGMKLLPVALALATQVGALLLLGRARERRGTGVALGCGLAWGFAFVSRAETLLFLPVVLLALAFTPSRGRGESRWRLPLFCLAGMVVVVLPFTAHNVRRGDPVLIAAAGGENLFIGNQRGATGGHHPLHPQAGDLFSQRALARIVAEEERGRELRPSEISDYWRSRAFEEILASPGAWLGLELRKLGLILHPGDPADIYSLPLERGRFLRALYLLPLSALGIWLLAIPGLVLALRERGRALWPLALFCALHLVVLMAFFVSTRLRLPLLVLLTPFAGYAIHELRQRWTQGRQRLLALALAFALIASSVVWLFFTPAQPREVLRLASVLSMQGRLDESLESLDALVREPEPDPLALDQAGWVLFKMGDLAGARNRYLRALEAGLAEERQAQTRTRLAMVHERLGEFDLARAMHDRAVAQAAEHGGAYYERGMFLLRRGEREAAIRDLLRARSLAPDWPPPREALRSIGIH